MLLFYVCFCNHLGALGFVGPDEPRYASIARAMAETSDWVTPRLNGQPWFEKPVLYYWKAGVTFRLFGVSESAARLPSALSATFAALVMAWAARRRFGRAAALLTVLFMTTAVGMIGFARAATPDMLFAACLAGTMAAAAEFLWPVAGESRPNAFFRISLGVLLGGAALAKGPAALVLAGGSVALWTFASRRWRDALRLLDPLAMLSFLIVALPWHIVCALRNPDFLRVFFLSHNLERYLTPVFHHEQPAWYFVGILALGLAPWTFLIVPLARDAFRSWRAKSAASSPALFFAAWVAFPFFFFSFSKSKLPGYILPAIPPLILLLARSAARLLEENNLLARLSSGAIGASFIAAGFSLNHWLKRLPAASEVVSLQAVLGLALACAAGGLAILLLGVSGKLRGALLAAALFTAALVEVAGIGVLPRLDPILSPRTAVDLGAMLIPPSVPVAAYRLSRAWKYGLDYYLHRDVPEWTPATPLPCSVFTTEAGLRDFQQRGIPMTSVRFGSGDAWLVNLKASLEPAPRE